MTANPHRSFNKHPIPPQAGIGLRPEHFEVMLQQLPNVAWLEVHSENYFGDGGAPLYYLNALRQHYPLSLHGVGLSLGSADPLNTAHLQALKNLIDRFEPALVSEHLSWSSINGQYFNDLFPLPYTEAALQHMVERIDRTQTYLGRILLVENVSSYVMFEDSDIPEWEFLLETAKRSGCGILLDINNIYVNANNHGLNPYRYIDHIDGRYVQEVHLGGHTVRHVNGETLLIDTHDHPVCDDVWRLYQYAVERFGAKPTLIEWDAQLPPLDELVNEARKAQAQLEAHHESIA